jgi:YVTN family beta-propeller protein
VSVISTTTNAVVATIPVEPEPMGVAVTPNGARVYITHPYLDKVSLIITTTNPANNTVKTIDIPPPSAGWVGPVSGPYSVAIAPGGSRAYVTNKFSDSVTVIDTASNISGPMAVLIPRISVGSKPWGVAVAPNGNVYVANSGSDSVSVIDTGNHVATIPNVRRNPVGVAIDPSGNHVFVSYYDDASGAGGVSVIDTNGNKVVTHLPGDRLTSGVSAPPGGVGQHPYGLVATAKNVYVAYSGSDIVWVIDI